MGLGHALQRKTIHHALAKTGIYTFLKAASSEECVAGKESDLVLTVGPNMGSLNQGTTYW